MVGTDDTPVVLDAHPISLDTNCKLLHFFVVVVSFLLGRSVVFVHVLSMLSSAVSLFITIISCDAFTCYMYLRFHFTCDQSVLCFVSLC